MAQRHLPLGSLNHVSRVVADVQASAAFYRDVLGFVEVKRPGALDFRGAWLWGYSLGIHLIEGVPPPRSGSINPKAEHLSFQAAGSLLEVEECLNKLHIPFVKQRVVECGIEVLQVFFHDPDNNMIELCDCENLPVLPLCGPCTAAEQPAAPVRQQGLGAVPAAASSGSCLSMQDSGDEELVRFYAAALGAAD